MQKVEDGCQQNWKWDHMIKSISKIEKWKDWKVPKYGLGVLIGKTENGTTWSNLLQRFYITSQQLDLFAWK